MKHSFWLGVYNLLIIPVLYIGMHVARLFNPKIREGIRGRKGLFRRLKAARQTLAPGKRFIVIHCTSAGELEAARPILQRLRERLPHLEAHVTCYSPSGMRSLTKIEEISSYSYLPFDDLNSAKRFFHILDPAAFLIIKHDVWPNMVWAAARRGIPVLWVNANLHVQTKRLRWWARGLNRSFLVTLSEILTVGDEHAQRLVRLVSAEKVLVLGDTRYDRTIERMAQVQDTPEEIRQGWTLTPRTLVGGSTWGSDQRVLIPAFAKLKKEFADLKLILVPHEPNEEFLRDTEDYLKGYGLSHLRLSSLGGQQVETDVLIVDKVGILASLYRLAWAAYVGGAFGEGVHSVLEPAIFKLPLFFGPKYYMSHEAQGLLRCGGAKSVKSAEELQKALTTLLADESAWLKAAEASRDFVQAGSGATEKVIDHLETWILSAPRT